MNLQVIKSVTGEAEYVLLPVYAYERLKPHIDKILSEDYVPFIAEDYISNPVALARIKAGITQKELAGLLNVSQGYISKLESQQSVSPKALNNVINAIQAHRK